MQMLKLEHIEKAYQQGKIPFLCCMTLRFMLPTENLLRLWDLPVLGNPPS